MAVFKHGDRITCVIGETIIKDARVSIDSSGEVYICQDFRDGSRTEDRFGYRFSYTLGNPVKEYHGDWEKNTEGVRNIKLLRKKDKVARRTFRQLKDTPDVKKGALWQEQCEDGTQPYSCITTGEHYTGDGELGDYIKRSLVEDQPAWFEEVFAVTPPYMNKQEMDAWEAFRKATAAAPKRRAGRPKKEKA